MSCLYQSLDRLTNQPGQDTLFQLILTIGNEVVATGGLGTVNIYKTYEKLRYEPCVRLFYTQKDFRNKGLDIIFLRGFAELLIFEVHAHNFMISDKPSNIPVKIAYYCK